MKTWYRDGKFWRHVSDIDMPFGFKHVGIGDIIFNSLYKVMQEDDYSEWAYSSLTACADLLIARKRWPDRIQKEHEGFIAKSRIEAWISRIMYETGVNKLQKFRPQHDCTRDGYIAFYAAAWKMNRWQFIEVVTVPWYLYRPTLWTWRKYIMSGDIKYLRRYRFWSRFSTSQKDYVVRLRNIREEIIGATLYKNQ